MSEGYFNLKQKLEDLGYNYSLPIDAVPLVECIVADLLQTTRSLQHYMDLSKDALIQRDSLMMEAEPYKCDNAKLIRENNLLHKEILTLKEENLRLSKELKRKTKCMTDEIMKKDVLISKLQHDIRDLSLRGLCAGTQSSRNKSRRKDDESTGVSKICICSSQSNNDLGKDTFELSKTIQILKDKNDTLVDEVTLLKSKIEHRDDEILRLNMLLEGGRPITAINKDFHVNNSDQTDLAIFQQFKKIQIENDGLKKEIHNGLGKQHEAMLRALSLADKNRNLEEELQKVDRLALQVEEECNKKLASLANEVNYLQTRLESLRLKNSELQRELSEFYKKDKSPQSCYTQESLNLALKERDILQKEIKDLIDINKNLQEKIGSLSQFNKNYHDKISMDNEHYNNGPKCLQKEELQKLLMEERVKYEKYMIDIQEKLSEALNVFNKHVHNGFGVNSKQDISPDNTFVRDLHSRLCESEQKILMLKQENTELKQTASKQEDNNRENLKDVIKQLNMENTQLTKENISLCQQLSQNRMMSSVQTNPDESSLKELSKLKDKNDSLMRELNYLKKDQQEYQLRYKETVDLVEKLKRDLALKQKQIEQLEEENYSYKMTNRTGKASVDQLRDECNFLREQIKTMQTDVIKEKTIASQIKNIQIETERNSSEVQNELLNVQKKLSLSRDQISSLEKKCKELQSEMNALKIDKTNLIENIKSIDRERDKLVIELDTKTERISNLDDKVKSQAYEISKLDKENDDLKRKLNIQKSTEHKVADYESQIMFLNGEISRFTQQNDTAVMENKRLQNSLGDANGALKLTKLELEKSRKEVDSLKQQLQHYVAEIRRIEELLSQKEAERSDMLEQFASLSVEANILENTNHSLESESASKSIQLQGYVNRIQNLESKLIDKENLIDSQSAQIAAMTCKVNTLENEIKLISDEKKILEQNISYMKQMCSHMQMEQSQKNLDLKDTDSELKLYENKIKCLSNTKAKLQVENDEMKSKLSTTEKLLSNARREIIELKLALQDATSETKSLKDCVSRLSREPDIHEHTLINEDIALPHTFGDIIHEVSNEDDEDSIIHGWVH
ncbi:PREDICTED: centrosomal protein of 135 kDa isoform X2 [Papilio polytes]|uniref:centrosomal protein of 135 kDa isoform X2 n=1 Tax=Papilio polytes TaxID=76194 RepID=UPI0006760C02|nr:PREDICTED: centrosomal protein of 135 kDa isoform X2 [Papilio polytes]